MTFLELQDVSKSYTTPKGRKQVLQNIHLAVNEGEFVVIVGASGSGKTTLMSLIGGLIAPDTGRLSLNGGPISVPGPERGMVFQNYSLLPWLSVFDNIYLAVEAVSPQLSKAAKRQRTAYWIQLVHLSHAAARRPHELSGGMRQRVAVARGLAMDPKLLLLDEPFSALDALTRTSLQEELTRIWLQQRKTVVMITHDIAEAILLADRIYPLTAGLGATLGPGIAVELPRPRTGRRLSLEPAYQHVRGQLSNFLRPTRAVISHTRPAHMRPVEVSIGTPNAFSSFRSLAKPTIPRTDPW